MKKLLVGNWKMNPENSQKAENIFSDIKKSPSSENVEVVIIPPFPYILLLKERGISLGAQNLYYEKSGAFTGEISADILKNIGCKYVLVGHSERRNIFLEDDETVNKKIKAALESDLIPILCVGETEEEKNNGKTGQVIKSQLAIALKNINPKEIIVAYEPVWAIGTKNPCKPENALKMRILIKKQLSEIIGRSLTEKTLILYGGSVNLDNSKSYIKEAGFNGLLVGGVSLKANEFSRMILEIDF